MSRYFFHVADGTVTRDEEGEEFGSLHAAQIAAAKFAGAMLIDNAARFWIDPEWELRVTDGSDLTLFTVSFTGTVSPAGQACSACAPGD